jgi:SAM-dependent methyltransferase
MILDPDTFRANLLKYTDLAFGLLPKIERPTILDAGCGTGVPTIRLAELCDGKVVALDTDQAALRRLAEKLAQKGLSNRVTLVNCPIEKIPFVKETFDVVWAEGSISRLGFKAAKDILGQYLKHGGFLVVHDDANGYLEKICTVESAGFSLLGFFHLSDRVWWDQYYKHLESALASADSVRPPHELSAILKELQQFRIEPNRFQSSFFVMRKS